MKAELTGLPGIIAGLKLGVFDELQAVAFQCATWCGARIFFVTMRHILVTFPGEKPTTYRVQMTLLQILREY